MKELDPEATAYRYAETLGEVLTPVYRPVDSRWLNVALVVDDTPSTRLWWSTAEALRLALARHGAFRSVECYTLRVRRQATSAPNEGPETLSIHRVSSLDARDTVAHREILNASSLAAAMSDRAILLVTDGVSAAWRSEPLLTLLSCWGTRVPCLVLQLLPQHLWHRTAIGAATGWVTSRRPAEPNSRLTWHDSDGIPGLRHGSADDCVVSSVPLPLAGLDRPTLEMWANLMALRIKPRALATRMSPIADATPPSDPRALSTEEHRALARERVRHFWRTASPEAAALLRSFAALPLTLPIMRLAARALVPDAEHGHIVEVMLSGLLVKKPGQQTIHPDEVQYDFVPGVRAEVANVLTPEDVQDYLKVIFGWLRTHWGSPRATTALLPDPSGRYGERWIDPKLLPLARASVNVLGELGNRFSAIASELAHGAEPKSHTVPTPESRPKRIYLAGATDQFRECCGELASDLRAVGAEVKVMQDFTASSNGTLLQDLENYIASCDRVIFLVGDGYGTEPSPGAVPPQAPRRSHTQWEYFFAQGERLDGSRAEPKQLFVYFASDAFRAAHPHGQGSEEVERQRRFEEEVRHSCRFSHSFGSLDELSRLVIKDGFQLPDATICRVIPRNLPYGSIGSLLKGREKLLAELRGRMERDATISASSQVLLGLGGVGKTRLAIEYALCYQSHYCALLFADASSCAQLQSNLASFCAVLRLPEQAAKEEADRVDAALRWMHEHDGWLLILDGADTLEAENEVERLLGPVETGHILITSRYTHSSYFADSIEVDVLQRHAAAAFLLERTADCRPLSPTDAADADALARELGGLALALEQAGAYIVKFRVALAEYLRRWKENDKNVRNWCDPRQMLYPKSIAVTWDSSFSQLDPEAQALLNVLCWFAPDPIPRDLFRTDATRRLFDTLCPRPHTSSKTRGFTNNPEFALDSLREVFLLKWVDDLDTSFQIHRLVAEVTRDRLPREARANWLLAALTIISNYLPTDPPPYDARSWPQWDSLRPHIATLIEGADDAGISEPTASLVNNLGLLHHAKGDWGEAKSWFRYGLSKVEGWFGSNSPINSALLGNLGMVLQETGDLSEAEPFMRRALAAGEIGFGPEHPSVALRLNNLSQLLQATNRFAEAEPLMRRALAINELSFGPDHPNVAIGFNNLAQLLQSTNRLPEAEPLMQRALAINEKSFGPNHPNVAISLNNLAQLLKVTNRFAEAEPLMRRALAINELSFGPDHPNVAIGLNNLAQLLQSTNRLPEAEPLMHRALAINEKSFGPNHPNVAISLNNLAQLLKVTNRFAEAEPLMRRALAINELSFGPDHPNVAISLNNLAQLLKVTNRSAEAEPLMHRALAIDAESFGPDHLDVARDLNNLARLLKDSKRITEAQPLMRRHIEILLRVTAETGYEHPRLRAAFENYIELLSDSGRFSEEIRAEMSALVARYQRDEA